MSKKNKGVVPIFRFPQFDKNGEWENKLLKQVGEFIGGGTPDTNIAEYWDGEIQWFTPTEIKDRFLTQSIRTITESGLKNSSAKLLPEGALLICTRAKVGDVGIAKNMCCTNQGFQSLVVKNSEDNLFWYYWILHHKKELLKRASGSTFIEIGKSEISNIPSFRPNKQEQQKIAACLSSLDDLITAENQKLETLKAHKNGLLQNLFPAEGETLPKLRFNTTGYWEEKPLGKIAQNLNSKRIPITENLRIKGNIPYIGASGIIDYVKDYIFDDDLLCISEDGANLLMRTYPIAFSITGKTWVNNHAHVLKFENKYIQIIVENQLNNKNLEDFLTGMAQPKLNRAKLDLIPIQIPVSTEEQQKIASHLTASDSLITLQTQKIESLKLHKKGLMQGLFPDTTEITA